MSSPSSPQSPLAILTPPPSPTLPNANADDDINVTDLIGSGSVAAAAVEDGAHDQYHQHHNHAHQHARDIDDLINATDAVHFHHHADDDANNDDRHGDYVDYAINDDDDNHHPDHLADTFSHQPATGIRPSRRPPPQAQHTLVEREARQRCRRQHYAPVADHIRLNVDDARHSNASPARQRPSTELWLDGDDELAAEAQRRRFQLTKQHTGMKNMSYNVTAAVAPASPPSADAVDIAAQYDTQQRPSINGNNHHHHWQPQHGDVPAKLDQTFVEMKPRQHSSYHANANGGDGQMPAGIPAYRPVVNQLCESAQIAEAQRLLQLQQVHQKAHAEQPEGVTDQGYFDLKFYHNKLW